MMPIAMSVQGDRVKIKTIKGEDDVKKHLAAMGFVNGSEVTVVKNIGGDMILQVRGSRVALGRDLVMRIMI